MMEKVIKVLLADDSEHFGKPCAAIMRAHSLDVHTVQKDGRQVYPLSSRCVGCDYGFLFATSDAIGVKGYKG